MFLELENNSGKFQNNAINDVKQISLSHVIIKGKVNIRVKTYLFLRLHQHKMVAVGAF